MSGGKTSNTCGGSTGVTVGSIGGHAHISYAKAALTTGGIHCGQDGSSTGGSGSLSVPIPAGLQNLQVTIDNNNKLQNMNILRNIGEGAAHGALNGLSNSFVLIL